MDFEKEEKIICDICGTLFDIDDGVCCPMCGSNSLRPYSDNDE
jgi:rRNA maturation endonuclease Nob1